MRCTTKITTTKAVDITLADTSVKIDLTMFGLPAISEVLTPEQAHAIGNDLMRTAQSAYANRQQAEPRVK